MVVCAGSLGKGPSDEALMQKRKLVLGIVVIAALVLVVALFLSSWPLWAKGGLGIVLGMIAGGAGAALKPSNRQTAKRNQ